MSKPRTKSQPGKEAKDRDRLSKFTEAIRQYSDFSEFLSSDTMPLMTALEQLHKPPQAAAVRIPFADKVDCFK